MKRISPSTRAAVFVLLIDPLVQQDKPERAPRFLFELENGISLGRNPGCCGAFTQGRY